MTAPVPLVELLESFVQCFTDPGFEHFKHFILAHAVLWSAPHCVTETLRATRWHDIKHWTASYVFMKRGRWSCQQVLGVLIGLVVKLLPVGGEWVVTLDDTVAKKTGRSFFGLGCYPDPTDKNPGASRRRVWGHCWVVMALLWKKGRHWLCFPLGALLFVPEKVCPAGWPFQTKIELAVELLKRLAQKGRKIIAVVDNLYAKAALVKAKLECESLTLVSRLRSNAALYELPAPRKPGKRGPQAMRGRKVSAQELWERTDQRQSICTFIYGKWVTIEAFVGVLMPSRTLGDFPVLVILFPQRSRQKWNIFFTTDLTMAPARLLELYGARFKIEDAFDELKTCGGLGDCRQRSFTAQKRHVTLCLIAYTLLRLLSVTIAGAQALEVEPWWHPTGPPSVTRLRRALAKWPGISCSLQSHRKLAEILAHAKAA